MKQTYKKQGLSSQNPNTDSMEFIDALEGCEKYTADKILLDNQDLEEGKNITKHTKNNSLSDCDKAKKVRRRRRKSDRTAKKHQIELATSVPTKHKSLYRWNPLWHKTKLADTSDKKINSDENFAKNALKEHNNSSNL